MNEAVVQEPDHQAGFSGHGGMGSMPRERVAEDSVFGIVRAAADEIARIKVAHDKGNLPRVEPLFDLLAQEHTDVVEPEISRSVALVVASVSQQLLPRAFSHGD